MSVHYERRPHQQAYQHLDNLGYVRCHDCTPEELRRELEFAAPPCSEEPCVQCGRIVGTVTVETTATACIESTRARIF